MGKESPGMGGDGRRAATTSHQENLVGCTNTAASHENQGS